MSRTRLSHRHPPVILEALESRTLLSAAVASIESSLPAPLPLALTIQAAQIPIISNKVTFFRDNKGVQVKILLTGPGSGYVTLTNGKTRGAELDTLVLNGTNQNSTLTVTLGGGRSRFSTLHHLVINKADGATAALKSFYAPRLHIAANGSVQADGSIQSLHLRNIGTASSVDIQGNLSSFIAEDILPTFDLTADTLGSVNLRSLGIGAFINAASAISSLNIQKSVGIGSYIQAGTGGIAKINVGGLYSTIVSTPGPIGNVTVNGDMIASSITSNFIPGPDGQYGTSDDDPLDDSRFGSIGTIRIQGALRGSASSSTSYGIVTVDLDKVIVGKKILSDGQTATSADGKVHIIAGPYADATVTLPDFDVSKYMNWSATGPRYSSNVSYTSAGKWENLKVINYSPSHFARVPKINGTWTITDNNNVPVSPTFQNALATDLPNVDKTATYIGYINGNPEINVYNDLKQLQNAGFNGVRLYDVPTKVAIATINAAYRLSHEAGSKGAFYVEYEVATPDLSVAPYIGTDGTSLDQRIENLFKFLTATNTSTAPQEGPFERLHDVIANVTPAVFSEIVPLVFFGHEDLVSPTSVASDATLNDTNTSAPLLRWGINATRQLLAKELAGHALPSVTNALLAGQVIQVSLDVHPLVSTLINVIQADPNSPIAYDNYPFQWGNIYYNTQHDYINDNANIIANAYPTDSSGTKITYWDRTVVNNVEWINGEPPIAPHFTVADTVNKADLFWSLQWIVDRVNWLWGTPQYNSTGKAKQLIAETGWASADIYQPGGTGKKITGDLASAKAYYAAIAASNFKIGNGPVMFFEAYDEPIKNNDPNLPSENHYGVFNWTGIPKLIAEDNLHPLTKPFAIVAIAPFFNAGKPQSLAGQAATDTAYTIKINNGPVQNIPWFWGGTSWSDNINNRTMFIPNPNILLNDGDIAEITPTHPNPALPSGNKTIRIKYSAATNTVTYLTPTTFALTPPNSGELAGSKWQLNTSFDWYHPDNDFTNTTKYPFVYQDWWAS